MFDVGHIITGVILMIQCLCILFVAQDTGLIYLDEAMNASLSDRVDQKNDLYEPTAAQGPSHFNELISNTDS